MITLGTPLSGLPNDTECWHGLWLRVNAPLAGAEQVLFCTIQR